MYYHTEQKFSSQMWKNYTAEKRKSVKSYHA